ncbi:tyrosine-type recombinase/integrase [Leucobacter chromiiresistens]
MRTGPTPPKAEANLVAALHAHLTPSVDYLTPDSTLSDLASQWLDEVSREKKAPSTQRRYEAVVRKHVNDHLGGLRIKEANVPRLQRILDLVADNSGASQARILGVVFKGMFGLATRYGATRDNPASHIRLPTAEKKNVRAPSMDDLSELFRLLGLYDRGIKGRTTQRDLLDFAGVMLATGGRIGEVLALKFDEDIDFDNRTILMQATLSNVPGEGLRRTKPKSTSSQRLISVPDWGMAILVRRRALSLNGWVFESDAGTPRWPEAVRTQWREALKGSKVEWMIPHDLRKAVATLLGSEAAKDQLGHSSINVTNKHYVEYDPSRPDQSAALAVFAPLTLHSSPPQ